MFGSKNSAEPFQPQFSEDWVSYQTAVWLPKLEAFRHLRNTRYLEIGVFEGRSLIWMMQNIFTHPSSHADVVDNFYDKTEKTLRKNLEGVNLNEKVTIHQGDSNLVLPKLENQYDVIYIDGCHCPPHILNDSVLSWEKLKPGGIMIFDDYLLDVGDYHKTPQVAIDSFITCFEPELEVLHKYHCVIVRKVPWDHRP